MIPKALYKKPIPEILAWCKKHGYQPQFHFLDMDDTLLRYKPVQHFDLDKEEKVTAYKQEFKTEAHWRKYFMRLWASDKKNKTVSLFGIITYRYREDVTTETDTHPLRPFADVTLLTDDLKDTVEKYKEFINPFIVFATDNKKGKVPQYRKVELLEQLRKDHSGSYSLNPEQFCMYDDQASVITDMRICGYRAYKICARFDSEVIKTLNQASKNHNADNQSLIDYLLAIDTEHHIHDKELLIAHCRDAFDALDNISVLYTPAANKKKHPLLHEAIIRHQTANNPIIAELVKQSDHLIVTQASVNDEKNRDKKNVREQAIEFAVLFLKNEGYKFAIMRGEYALAEIGCGLIEALVSQADHREITKLASHSLPWQCDAAIRFARQALNNEGYADAITRGKAQQYKQSVQYFQTKEKTTNKTTTPPRAIGKGWTVLESAAATAFAECRR